MSASIPAVRIARPTGRPPQIRYTDPATNKEVRISTGSYSMAEASKLKQLVELQLANELIEESTCGFVYVLSNKAMPGLVKVGMTRNHPRQRADQLRSTGVPFAFDIESAIYCRDAAHLESRVHKRLAKWRTVDDREFFSLPASDATRELLQSYIDEEWTHE